MADLTSVIKSLPSKAEQVVKWHDQIWGNKMKERFVWSDYTEKARATLNLAKQLAVRLKKAEVNSDLILMALIQDRACSAARLLDRMRVSLSQLSKELEERQPPDMAPSEEPNLSDDAVKAIRLAYTEANGLGNDYVGSEHLLLGVIHLLSEEEVGELIKRRVRVPQLRKQLIRIQDQHHSTTGRTD